MELLYKPWDSIFFGIEIYDILIDDEDIIFKRAIPIKCKALLQANVSISEYLKITFLLREGFKWVSTTLCFQKILTATTDNQVLLKNATHYDIEEIRNFLPGMYRYSRFLCENYYPPDAADRLYDEWLLKAYDGSYDDGVLVYKEDSKVGGFVTYRMHNKSSKIGLLGVNPEFLGRGLGSQIIDGFERMCTSRSIKEIQVDTQQLNSSAIKLYVKKGYDICDIRPWMYKRD